MPAALASHLTESEQYWEAEALPTLSDYIRIPCLSPDFDAAWEANGHIDRAGELLLDWARSRAIAGLTIERFQMPGLTPVLIAEVPASGSGSGSGDSLPTLLYGHFDKQPPLGAWRTGLGPFEPVREDDCLYGRGAADDGYSLFAALGAIELAQRSGAGHGRCVAIIEASEESGSPHLAPYLSALSERLGPAGPGLVVCLDSGASTYDRLWWTTSLRGLVDATVRVSVLTAGIHSGAGGGIVPDSFRLLRSLLNRIEDEETGEVSLESCRVEIPEVRRSEAAALAAELGGRVRDSFPIVPGAASAGEGGFGGAGSRAGEAASETVDELLVRAWSAAVAYTGLDGMPAIADAGNVLRPFTALKIAMRIPPSARASAVAEELVKKLSADAPAGSVVEVGDIIAADGFDAPAMAPWLASAADEASRAYFGAPGRGMGEGGTIPFLAELQKSYPGAQFLVTGVLGPGSNAHGPDEMLHVPTAKRLTASIAHVLSKVPA